MGALGRRADSAISRITDIRLIWQERDGSEHMKEFETKEQAKKAIPKGVTDWVIVGKQYQAVKVLAKKR